MRSCVARLRSCLPSARTASAAGLGLSAAGLANVARADGLTVPSLNLDFEAIVNAFQDRLGESMTPLILLICAVTAAFWVVRRLRTV